jgi:hypothetical protein
MYKSITVLFLIFQIIFVNAQNYSKDFFKACKSKDLKTVKEYLDKGIDLERKNENGNTALMISSSPFNLDVVKLLVENGANLNAFNNEGKTVLTLLRTRNYNSNDPEMKKSVWEIYTYLQSAGAKEQDYVDFIAKNLSGQDNYEQKEVLKIKHNYQEYSKNVKTYKHKQFREEESSGDATIYSHIINEYHASYDSQGNLVFFSSIDKSEQEWHDANSRLDINEEFYLKNGKIYFYFCEETNGFSPIIEQYRVYIQNNEEVISAYRLYDNFYADNSVGIKDINDLANIKAKDIPKHSVEEIVKSFNNIYNLIKGKLK